MALLLTCGDGEERGEVYGCAADRQQASIVFEVAADMVRMCPALNKRVKILASQKRIVYQSTNSFYQVLSAEAYEEAKKSCKDPVILIEQKLDFSCYVPEGFGTGDCIIISDDKLHIIDFKYGQGIFVEAEHNP